MVMKLANLWTSWTSVAAEMEEGKLSWEHTNRVTNKDCVNGMPSSLQQEVEIQVCNWCREWATSKCETERFEVQWPDDLGEPPPPLKLRHFKKAAASFPMNLELGWEGIHPRALLRLSDEILEALLRILQACEGQGRWPRKTGMVLIALLPKPIGGRRPI